MASGIDLSRSVTEGSQECHDLPCTPCNQDNKHVKSVKFCVECREYLCDPCLKEHSRFGEMKNHALLDKDGKSIKTVQNSIQNLPTEKCEQHSGILDLFCTNHDAICCRACVASDHSSCKSIQYIPSWAQGFKSHQKVKQVQSQMKAVKANLDKIKKVREGEHQKIEKEKQTALTLIKDFRKEMNKLLDDMEQYSIDETMRRKKMIEDKINADIKQVDIMTQILETKINLLKNNCGGNESQLFINVKQGKNIITDGEKLSQKVENSVNQDKLYFSAHADIEKVLKTCRSLGFFCHKTVDVKVPTDKKQCKILGSCQLEDNTILITDTGNDKLKRLDKSYEVKDYIDLAGSPTGVCSTGPQEVAVSLPGQNKIQFVSVRDKMSLTKSFAIGEFCSGLVYSNSELFVCCNGQQENGPLHIRVYDTSGKHLRTFTTFILNKQIYYNKSDPRYITVSADGSSIYITDYNAGIIALDRQGNVMAKHTKANLQLQLPEGICMADKDQLIVCSSNNVIQVNKDGTNPRVLLEKSDGFKNPMTVCIDRNNHRVLVFSQCRDNINVYDLV